MERIQVVGMNPVWGLPSPSPFCLKLETWLRIAGIPYTAIALTKPPQSKTGKVPYLKRADGSILADSNIIIKTLGLERGIGIDVEADQENQARTHAALRMIEESLYFVAVWERWVDPEYWPITREAYFGTLPSGMRSLFSALVRRKIIASLNGQGICRLEPAQISAIGAADVKALSALLGKRPYFHGDTPGVLDASAYGSLANLLGFPKSTPLKSAVESCPNLVDFCKRMKDRYWSNDAATA